MTGLFADPPGSRFTEAGVGIESRADGGAADCECVNRASPDS